MEIFGTTRSRIARNYALITPDTHVPGRHPDWQDTEVVVHIAPEIGARFTQYTARISAGGVGTGPGSTVERVLFVREGECRLSAEGSSGTDGFELREGSFAFIPAGTEHRIESAAPSTLIVFEKIYRAREGVDPPSLLVGHESDHPGESFMGDDDLRLQTLLPISDEFDMAVNIFTYQPGATLPQVEIHVMEHGLLMLAGSGVYRLGDDYFPVTDGDTIWMGSYCPQWFVAMGKQPATYLYYKDIHRDRLTDK